MPTSLVLGSGGFLGVHLVGELLSTGQTVVGCQRSVTVKGSERHRTVEGDLWDLDLVGLLRDVRPSTVYHLANRAFVPQSLIDPIGDLHANAGLTLKVLEALRQHDEPVRLAYASSAAVYGSPSTLPIAESQALKPASPYGVSKATAEAYLRLYHRQYGVPSVALRFFSVYGPGLRKQVVHDLLVRAIDGDEVLHVDGVAEHSRDFIFVRDAARAMRTLGEAGPVDGSALNVASGVETTLAELADVVTKTIGRRQRVVFSGVAQPGYPTRWRADTRALQAFDPAGHSALAVGVATTHDWLMQERSG